MYKNIHSIISIILLFIIFIGTILTKVIHKEKYEYYDSGYSGTVDRPDDVDARIRSLLAENRDEYEWAKQYYNNSDQLQEKLCSINEAYSSLCQNNCTLNLDEDTKARRNCYNYCLNEDNTYKSDQFLCVDNVEAPQGYSGGGEEEEDDDDDDDVTTDPSYNALQTALTKCKQDWMDGEPGASMAWRLMTGVSYDKLKSVDVPVDDHEFNHPINHMFSRYVLSQNL